MRAFCNTCKDFYIEKTEGLHQLLPSLLKSCNPRPPGLLNQFRYVLMQRNLRNNPIYVDPVCSQCISPLENIRKPYSFMMLAGGIEL